MEASPRRPCRSEGVLRVAFGVGVVYMRRVLLSLAVVGVAVGVTACPCRADLTERVMNRLQAADKEVAHGRVVYRIEYHKGPRLSAEEVNRRLEVQKEHWKQKGYDSRRMAESEAEFRRYLLGRHGVDAYKVTLTYLDRLHCKEEDRGIGPTSNVVVSLRDGANRAILSGKQMIVDPQIDRSLPPLIGLDPGPCFPMGRGLSRLKEPSAQRTSEGIVVTGTAPDGSFIRGIVDPQHGYVAKRIERYSRRDRRMLQVYALDHLRLVSGTVWIPARALDQPIRRSGQLRSTQKYILLDADFHRPDPSEVTVPLAGLDITDRRMGKTIGFTKVPAGVATLDDLLPYTRKVAEDLARVQAQFERDQAKRRRVEVLIGLLFGLTALASAVVALRSFRSLRQA